MRHGIRTLLTQHGFSVVGETSDGREAVRLAQRFEPDVAVLEILLPGLNGFDAAREIIRASPGTRVVFLTSLDDDGVIVDALQSGARAYITKTQPAKDLFKALRDVLDGAFYIGLRTPTAVAETLRLARSFERKPLSAREREVLRLVAEGRTTKEAAHLLRISIKTASFHRARIMRKLDIHATATLVRYAIKRGLITP